MVSPPAGVDAAHERLVAGLLAAGAPYGLLLAGGDAVRAHGLVPARVSRGVDLVTEHPAAMAEIAGALRAGAEGRGWTVEGLDVDPLAARLVVGDPASGARWRVDLRKEVLWRPAVRTGAGPVLSLEDLVGTTVRALADRGLPRDLVDVHAAARRWSHPELEELGRRHAPDTFDLAELQSRLAGTEWLDDGEFRAQGLDGPAVEELRRWAQVWADDIAERLVEGEDPEPDPPGD
ncbi:nucleotidyl transferase AbiEii/AbiGii toxin family protein [Streptomyces sp. SLBN-134]|uniref:nucleotidyl transferase AbiEii/AbiGii toxin family protein n=1 Tax=Streptomyces sp. SLBN-134 TaxID=2768456 RepID=UPI00114FADE4|nr:nucleotidyl transferase AbiEii/AbiGii toxin family protein [Streptomyces sp. SLBN-134]TQL21901.1 nucleotidyltransferase AbiEii toxin of type IV toxin-antitoxin system [Streptomyces sp. SLBN-134]